MIASIAIHFLLPDIARANCSLPTASIGSLDFQSSVFKYCDGTNWQTMGGVSFPLTGPNGTATGPTYSFSAGTNTGMYSTGAGTIAFTTAGTQRMTIDSSGSVGIGTTAPNRTVEISPASNVPSLRLAYGAGSSSMEFKGNTLSADYIFFQDYASSNNNGYIRYNNPGSGTTYGGSANALVLGTSQLDRMVIDAAGNVGIGTTTPGYLLDVAGTATFGVHTAWGPSVRLYGTDTTWGDGVVEMVTAATGHPTQLNFSYTGGTITPRTYFQDTGTQFNLVSKSGNNGTGTQYNVMTLDKPSGNLALNTTGGNVGIGTSSPTSLIHVYSNTNASMGVTVQDPTSTSTTVFWAQSNGGGGGVYNTGTGSSASWANRTTLEDDGNGLNIWAGSSTADVRFFVNGWTGTAERMRINSSGYVGIASTSPVSTLDVAGQIRSKDVSNAGTTIDFATGNYQYTSAACGAMTLNNMKSGSSYMLAVQGAAGGTCSFTAWTNTGTGALTVKSAPVSLVQTAGFHTIFTFAVMGSFVYVTSVDGY